MSYCAVGPASNLIVFTLTLVGNCCITSHSGCLIGAIDTQTLHVIGQKAVVVVIDILVSYQEWVLSRPVSVGLHDGGIAVGCRSGNFSIGAGKESVVTL